MKLLVTIVVELISGYLMALMGVFASQRMPKGNKFLHATFSSSQVVQVFSLETKRHQRDSFKNSSTGLQCFSG